MTEVSVSTPLKRFAGIASMPSANIALLRPLLTNTSDPIEPVPINGGNVISSNEVQP